LLLLRRLASLPLGLSLPPGLPLNLALCSLLGCSGLRRPPTLLCLSLLRCPLLPLLCCRLRPFLGWGLPLLLALPPGRIGGLWARGRLLRRARLPLDDRRGLGSPRCLLDSGPLSGCCGRTYIFLRGGGCFGRRRCQTDETFPKRKRDYADDKCGQEHGQGERKDEKKGRSGQRDEKEA